jgi:CMP-N-acetylneuraminate monooxygenase
MYKMLEKLVNQTIQEEISIPLNKIHSADGGFVTIDDIFVGLKGGGYVAFDRVCDHNGGQLILDSNNLSATCPIHKWTLKLSSGLYENGCPKKALLTRVESENLIVIKPKERFPEIISSGLTKSDIEFKFNAHASVSIKIDEVDVISDPWLIGSCFANGWWHAFPPSNEAIERLINSNFIYISHNHPDHLHIPTLETYVQKTKSILVPNFESKSVENILRRIGFENLIVCDFMQQIQIETKNGGFKIIIVKSGDDRDDSSMLICTENKKVFLGVDTNMPNRWILPKVDVLFTPFAGGASGFPVRVENFNLERKIEIINANRSSVLNNHVAKLVGATMPGYVIPYAGYFTEIGRDNDVKVVNIKNSPQDLISYVEEKFPNTKGINPIDNPCFRLGVDGLKCEEIMEAPAYFVDEDYISSVISDGLKGRSELTSEELLLIGKKFLSSTFSDNLTVVLIPANDSITKDIGFALKIDFSPQHRNAEVIYINGETDSDLISSVNVNLNNLEILRVRAESLALVVRDGLPLEDLSIGFQIKMYRDPNIYNFKFWDHFTNKEFISI